MISSTFSKRSSFSKTRDHRVSCLLDPKTREIRPAVRKHPAVLPNRNYFLQPQLAEELHIVVIPVRTDHDRARSKVRFCRIVRQNRYFSIVKRNLCPFSDQGFVPFVFRIHDDSLAGADQFGPGTCR